MRIPCFSSAMLAVVLEHQYAAAVQLDDHLAANEAPEQNLWLSQGQEIIKTDD